MFDPDFGFDVPDEPLYEHGCRFCRYLGDAVHAGRRFDLYYCERGHFYPTVLARGSSHPHDVVTGIALALVDVVLWEAVERARRKGWFPQDVPVEVLAKGPSRRK